MDRERVPTLAEEQAAWEARHRDAARAKGRIAAAALLGLVALLASSFRDDPFSLALVSGLVTACGLIAVSCFSVAGAGGVLIAAAAAGFLLGERFAGLVLAAALIQAAIYPVFRNRVRREDDHFFLASGLFWLLLALGTGGILLAGGQTTREAFRQMGAQLGLEFQQGLAPVLEMLKGDETSAKFLSWATFLSWAMDHPGTCLASILLVVQTLVTFLALRWARARLGWVDPIWGKLLLFRVHERYSILLILGLALLVLAPVVEGVDLATLAVPLLLWLSAGCFLGGLACVFYIIISLRMAQRVWASRLYSIGLALMLLLAPEALAIIGLADVWFDVRRLTPKKGEK